MENNYFLQELGFDPLVIKLPDEIANKIIGIAGVHYSGEHPAVIIKEVENFELPVLKDVAELQKQIWNNSTVIFLYVVSPVEIRIYNCNAKPVYSNDAEIEAILKEKQVETCRYDDKNKLATIKHIFSAIGIDCGTIWTSEIGYAQKIRLKTKVDEYLVDSLIALAKKLVDDINETVNDKKKSEEIVHSLLMRSIFIMYLQDRCAIPQSIWDKVGESNFLKILNSHEQTYKLFEIISSKFNGNAFPLVENEKSVITSKHFEYLQNCLTDGNINTTESSLFEKWRLFNFSLIRIEMLSEIYENFLSQFNPEGKKKFGAYFTPPALVELVLNNVLPRNETDYNKRILDPACGSGIFLAMAYKRLVERWKQAHKKNPDFKTLSKLLKDNIYGVEWDKNSIKVAAFSLYLSMLDFLYPKDVWLEEGKQFPNLIFDEESKSEQDKLGANLFRTNTIKANGKFENINYDLIIGNPPFGTNDLPETVKDYCKKYDFDKQFVIPFIHKSADLAKDGKVALLFNTQILTYPGNGFIAFRKWLFNDNYVEKVFNLSIFRNAKNDFGGSLFKKAKVPISIVIFKPCIPKNKEKTIEYWAPKTFVKNNVVEGVSIDITDVKHLPRVECEKPDTKIWKIAQWGNLFDYSLIENLLKNNPSVSILENENELVIKAGLHPKEKDKEVVYVEGEYLESENIQPYYTGSQLTGSIKNEFRRFELSLFEPTYVGVYQNIKNKAVCSSFFDKTIFFKKAIFLLKTSDKSKNKNYTILFNSNLSNYYFFLTAGCWGIERDQIFLSTEYKSFPVSVDFINKINDLDFRKTNFILNELDFDNKLATFDISHYKKEIYNAYKLNEKEIAVIEDFTKYTISLFYDKENSIALRPIAQENPETITYAKMLCDEINSFLISGNLKVSAKVYNVTPYTPLCIVKIKFSTNNKIVDPVLLKADIDFERDINAINEYTLSEYAQKIYIRKQVRYYTEDEIFIAKPNQKRFWTRSQGIDDAGSIINELISKSGDDE
ncbi:MAG: N-6 DNA methylase [Bacteroidales bacterium]|nr:N-6 DNA methylase [Bacteroidales bacterium]